MVRLLLIIWVLFFAYSNVYAKDIYVSGTGSDLVTYANNDINNPYLTVKHAFLDGNVLSGDNVYYRSGTYEILVQIDGRLENMADGTVGSRITHQPYPGESVTWASSLDPAFVFEADYITITGITVDTDFRFFWISKNEIHTGVTIDNCDLTLNLEGGGINQAPITIESRALDTTVTNCRFYTVDTYTNPNTAGIFIWRAEDLYIANNEFYYLPTGIFYKHTGDGVDSGNIIENNYFENDPAQIYLGSRVNGINTCSQYVKIRNNIFKDCNAEIQYGSGGSGDSGLNYGGDNNTFNNNTLYNSKLLIKYGTDGDASGAIDNILYNNLIASDTYEIWRYPDGYSGTDMTGGNTSDWTLYNSGDIIYNDRVFYTLAEWGVYTAGAPTSDEQDINSIVGTPTFTGGATPTTIAGFSLTSSSDGYQAGSDSKDMGAYVPDVGVNADPPTSSGTVGGARINANFR